MDTYTLVRTEHLNHNDRLFGGQLLKWIDENAFIAATLEHPKSKFVTRAFDNTEFCHGVINGSILRFNILFVKQGESSITYNVDVFSSSPDTNEEEIIFSTHVTFVSIDEKGNKVPIV